MPLGRTNKYTSTFILYISAFTHTYKKKKDVFVSLNVMYEYINNENSMQEDWMNHPFNGRCTSSAVF